MLVCRLTQLEQVLAEPQAKCSSERRGSEAKTVDIIKMLTNARTDYEKVRFLTYSCILILPSATWFSDEHCHNLF